MKTLVCFCTAQGRFALPVESTLAVRTTAGLVDLPSPRPDVVGVLPGDPPLSVSAALGRGSNQVLVVAVDGVRFGLHVLEVVGLQRCADDELGPPPLGQRAGPAGARHGGLIAATVRIDDELVLVADARSLAALL